MIFFKRKPREEPPKQVVDIGAVLLRIEWGEDRVSTVCFRGEFREYCGIKLAEDLADDYVRAIYKAGVASIRHGEELVYRPTAQIVRIKRFKWSCFAVVS